MTQNKLSHGISGASIQSWAPEGQQAQANIFKKILKYSDPQRKISLETILFLVKQVPFKYISLY